jgi:hypothetical protein|tara:strand:- start:38 stop:148 length:111 start_codon:yes stop_codon:yes gene_type:complete
MDLVKRRARVVEDFLFSKTFNGFPIKEISNLKVEDS